MNIFKVIIIFFLSCSNLLKAESLKMQETDDEVLSPFMHVRDNLYIDKQKRVYYQSFYVSEQIVNGDILEGTSYFKVALDNNGNKVFLNDIIDYVTWKYVGFHDIYVDKNNIYCHVLRSDGGDLRYISDEAGKLKFYVDGKWKNTSDIKKEKIVTTNSILTPYLTDGTSIFYRCYKIRVYVDLNSFEVVDGFIGLAKDKYNYFYKNKKISNEEAEKLLARSLELKKLSKKVAD